MIPNPSEEQIDFVLAILERVKDGYPLTMRERLRFAGCLQLMAQSAERGDWPVEGKIKP